MKAKTRIGFFGFFKDSRIFSGILLAVQVTLFWGCAHTLPPIQNQNDKQDCPDLDDGLSGVSADPTYGYAMNNAVRIGGGSSDNELTYMHMLLGPQQKFINGVFKVGNFWGDGISLSGYKVVMNGDTSQKIIYLDTHHCHDPKAPIGFTVRHEFQESKMPGLN